MQAAGKYMFGPHITLPVHQNQLAYEVSSFLPEKEGTPGGLYFGITYLYPGKVGNEYMMTKGHYHANVDRAEFYWGLEGEGMLTS